MTKLILDSDWPCAKLDPQSKNLITNSAKQKEIVAIARSRTFAIIKQLDQKRNQFVIDFLRDTSSLLQVFNSPSNDLFHTHDLSEMNFSGANFSAVYFGEPLPVGINLQRLNLRKANLSSANLWSADLRYTDLSKANLNNAILSYVNLKGTNIKNASFHSAILLAADFRQARGLTPEQFRGPNRPLMCNVGLPAHILRAGVKSTNPEDFDRINEILSDQFHLPLTQIQGLVETANHLDWEKY